MKCIVLSILHKLLSILHKLYYPSPAKPIDLLAKYIQSNEEDMDIEVQEPYLLLRGLNIVDLEDLLEDIKTYRDMKMDTHTDFWSVRIIRVKS